MARWAVVGKGKNMQHQNRILIVDDNLTNIAILEEILEDYPLRTATSGKEALRIAPDFKPSVLLLDIMMPEMNGYETCRRLRENPILRNTKIIMVSAKAMVSERLKGYEAGADDYITKPFDHDELLAKVRVYLKLKSMEEVDELKTNLLSLLSHETRTPLTGIMVPAEILMTGEDVDPERRKMWNMLHRNASRLQSLCEKVIILSAMKSGISDPQFTVADICEVVREAVCAVTDQASGRNVKIEQELCDGATALLDRQQMMDMVNSLLDNAIRFSPSDGRVVVGVSRDDESLCLTVSDQGEGIDPDLLPHVFEEFAHVQNGDHVDGQGLSLAIAREVVSVHEGTIGVESTPGSGAMFTVRLPVAAPEAKGKSAPRVLTDHLPNNLR